MATIFTAVPGSVTITRGLSQTYDFGKERLNHSTILLPSGNVYTYDHGPTLNRGILEFSYVTYAEAEAFRNWLVNQIRFAMMPFTITPASWDDIGRGEGVALGVCHYDGEPTTADVIRRRGQAGKFDIRFPYFSIDFDTVGIPADVVGG
jgi:hypothetical protein